MSKKFIPNGDQDFLAMAGNFASAVAKHREWLGVSVEDDAALTSAVTTFQATYQAARRGGMRSQVATAEKEQARQFAEKIIRRLTHLFRANESIDSAMRVSLGLRERTGKPKVLTVPNESPRLTFIRAIHAGGAVPQHELRFVSQDFKPRPAGAVRLELFVDLVAPDAPIPAYPGAAPGSRPFYVRSFSRSPIRFTPPMANVPMRVVYWGRWADSTGNVGPFSATAVGWIEGGSHFLMTAPQFERDRPLRIDVTEDPRAIDQQTTVVVALIEAMRTNGSRNRDSLTIANTTPAVTGPAQRDTRQIEGPASEAA